MRLSDAHAVAQVFGGSTDAQGFPAVGGARTGTVSVYHGHSARALGAAAGGAGVQYVDTPTQEDALSVIVSLIGSGAQDAGMQALARAITAKAPARNDWAELSAIFYACKNGRPDLAPFGLQNGLRYMADARTDDQGGETDVFFAPPRVLTMLKAGQNGFDCFPLGTRVLTREYVLAPIESLRPGDVIWGYDKWSEVQRVERKGTLKLFAVALNNGSTLRLTGDHKLWVAHCPRHVKRDDNPCSCPVAERELLRLPVREVQEGMILIQPERIPFGEGTMDVRRAYIEGLYISDGWRTEHAFFISGKDGFPKEEQKNEVAAICHDLGIKTTWYERSIYVADKAWSNHMALMGSRAPQKHALSINFEEGAALSLLRGIMADSGANTNGPGRTFTTTSRELFLQTRMLLKMAGITCGERYIVDHGGLGSHPIWRLQTRANPQSNGRSAKFLRVKEVIEDAGEAECIDIATDDHYVYLPEADCTVSNCDDQTMFVAALAKNCGFRVGARAYGEGDVAGFEHVYAVALIPKRGPWAEDAQGRIDESHVVGLDTTVPYATPGWQPPQGNVYTQLLP